jgi:hypothetical protein
MDILGSIEDMYSFITHIFFVTCVCICICLVIEIHLIFSFREKLVLLSTYVVENTNITPFEQTKP